MDKQEMISLIRCIQDFPIEGVLFRDITTLVKDAKGHGALIDAIKDSLKGKQVDLVIGPEARGFVIGATLAYALGTGFVMARKPGKLPCKTYRYEYGLEYGTDVLEIDEDAIKPGQKVVVVDDLLATGGTALATVKLVEMAGGEVIGLRFAMELCSEFDTRKNLEGYDVESVIQF